MTHSGNSGDIVFSIPTINHLVNYQKQAIVYIKAVKFITPYNDQYEFVKDLLLLQPGVKHVLPYVPPDDNWSYFWWPGLKPDYDLDEARHQRERGIHHIVKRYYDAFKIQKDHTLPFLVVDNEKQRTGGYALIHLTPRWRQGRVDWHKVFLEAKKRHTKVYFVGFQTEWLDFTIKYGEIEHLPTENLLELARLVRDCEAVYCNQGVILTLAQGLGKEYYLEQNYPKTNCLLFTPNEHIL